MKLFKKASISSALLLITFTFNSSAAEKQDDANTGWLSYAGATLLNGYAGFKKFLTSAPTSNTGFSNLPVEVQTIIIQLFAKSCADTTLKESAQTINSLAQVNTKLNQLINDPEFNLKLIKNRAKQFNVSDVKVTNTLKTKAAKAQLRIQFVLAKRMKEIIEEQENNDALTRLNTLLTKKFELDEKVFKVDLDFTYRWDKESPEYLSPLMYAVEGENKFLINYLINNGANINLAAFNGKTALMYANNPNIITFLASKPNLNINQQDSGGNTALLRVIQNYFPEDVENRENNIAVIQKLLEIGVNPQIANNNGETPLQAAKATGDQELIDLIQQAIDENKLSENLNADAALL